jgi:hypothetical protein
MLTTVHFSNNKETKRVVGDMPEAASSGEIGKGMMVKNKTRK